jgi:hypothetical protein
VKAMRTSALPSTLDPVDGAALAAAALMLAERFAQGATLWCLAAEWPEHGRHVAVEFVHPVVVGKPALPAISVVGAAPIDLLRTAVRGGDVLLAVGPTASEVTLDAVRRAPAWGISTIWLAAGDHPSTGAADHNLSVFDERHTARHDGTLVLRYHILWELTHVCLEHPGVLRTRCEDDVCITCSDEGQIVEVAAVLADGLVTARTPRGMETLDPELVGPVEVGDLLLAHAGIAIERMDRGDE